MFGSLSFCRFCSHSHGTKTHFSVIEVISFTALILHCEMRRCVLNTMTVSQQCYILTGAIITNVTWTLVTSVTTFGKNLADILWSCLYIFSLHKCQIKCPFSALSSYVLYSYRGECETGLSHQCHLQSFSIYLYQSMSFIAVGMDNQSQLCCKPSM